MATQWDAAFVHYPRRSNALDDAHRSMHAVADAINSNTTTLPSRVIYSESHDEVANGKGRVCRREITPDDADGWFAQKRSTQAAALVFTAPGIPMLFQGQEFLQGEWFRIRSPWTGTTAGVPRHRSASIGDLVKLRTNRNGLTGGLTGQHVHIYRVDDARNLIAFRRWEWAALGDDVLVVANFADAPVENYSLAFRWQGNGKVRFNSDSSFYGKDFGDYQINNVEAVEGEHDGLPANMARSASAPTASPFFRRARHKVALAYDSTGRSSSEPRPVALQAKSPPPITIRAQLTHAGLYTMPGGAEQNRLAHRMPLALSASPAKVAYPPAITNGSKPTMPPQYLPRRGYWHIRVKGSSDHGGG